MDDNVDVLAGMDEALHAMIAEGDLHTIYDPVCRDLIFFLPDQDVEVGAEELKQRWSGHSESKPALVLYDPSLVSGPIDDLDVLRARPVLVVGYKLAGLVHCPHLT